MVKFKNYIRYSFMEFTVTQQHCFKALNDPKMGLKPGTLVRYSKLLEKQRQIRRKFENYGDSKSSNTPRVGTPSSSGKITQYLDSTTVMAPHEAIYMFLVDRWNSAEIDRLIYDMTIFYKRSLRIQKNFSNQIIKKHTRADAFEHRWNIIASFVLEKAQKKDDKMMKEFGKMAIAIDPAIRR